MPPDNHLEETLPGFQALAFDLDQCRRDLAALDALLADNRELGEKMVSIQATDDRRVKVSLSLDPAVLDYLDTYVSAHPTINRSRVVELAVREFRQRQIETELEAQYAEPESREIQRELEDWRHIRWAAARRVLGGA